MDIAGNLDPHIPATQVLPLLLVTYRWYNNPRTKAIPGKNEAASSASKPKGRKPKDVEWYYQRLKKDNAAAEKLLRLVNN